MAVLIEIEALSKSYGAFQALQDVNARVPEGAIGLLGPNGAGKSTLIKTLLGLLDFQSGRARVLGHEVGRETLRIRSEIGYLPEMEAFFPGFTAHEMVVYGGRLSGLPETAARERAHVLLDYVLMGEERYRAVDSLSTGMKQKVKLAQALVHGPKLVFLDEPTNGLDPKGREEMLAIVTELPRYGVNVVLSSHLLHDVERVCESVVLMDRGQVLYTGPLADFRHDESSRYEVRVKEGPERLRAALEAAGCATELRPDGMLLIRLPDPDAVGLIWKAAGETAVQIRHLRPFKRTLQDAFVGFISARRNGAGALREEGQPGA